MLQRKVTPVLYQRKAELLSNLSKTFAESIMLWGKVMYLNLVSTSAFPPSTLVMAGAYYTFSTNLVSLLYPSPGLPTAIFDAIAVPLVLPPQDI